MLAAVGPDAEPRQHLALARPGAATSTRSALRFGRGRSSASARSLFALAVRDSRRAGSQRVQRLRRAALVRRRGRPRRAAGCRRAVPGHAGDTVTDAVAEADCVLACVPAALRLAIARDACARARRAGPSTPTCQRTARGQGRNAMRRCRRRRGTSTPPCSAPSRIRGARTDPAARSRRHGIRRARRAARACASLTSTHRPEPRRTVKLLRSVYMKGRDALVPEMMLAARRRGARPARGREHQRRRRAGAVPAARRSRARIARAARAPPGRRARRVRAAARRSGRGRRGDRRRRAPPARARGLDLAAETGAAARPATRYWICSTSSTLADSQAASRCSEAASATSSAPSSMSRNDRSRTAPPSAVRPRSRRRARRSCGGRPTACSAAYCWASGRTARRRTRAPRALRPSSARVYVREIVSNRRERTAPAPRRAHPRCARRSTRAPRGAVVLRILAERVAAEVVELHVQVHAPRGRCAAGARSSSPGTRPRRRPRSASSTSRRIARRIDLRQLVPAGGCAAAPTLALNAVELTVDVRVETSRDSSGIAIESPTDTCEGKRSL